MKKVVFLYAMTLTLSVVHAQPGTLDNSFGTGGKVTTTIGTSAFDEGYAIALQADGKIVVAGKNYIGSFYDFGVARYNSNGTLDNTFGTGGKVTTSIRNYDDIAYSLAVQSDGKIVVAGYSDTTSLNNLVFALVRYNSNGTLDNNFGSNGKAITAIGNYGSEINSIVIQNDGKIVAAGYSYNGSQDEIALVRYNSNGTLDVTFGLGGKTTASIGSNDRGSSLLLQPDGKIVVTGYSHSITSGSDFAIVRYNSNGILDNTFGSAGKVTTDFGLNDYGQSVAIQTDGKIVVGGFSADFPPNVFVLSRYNITGTLDTTFGSLGKVTTDISSGDDDEIHSLIIQADGKIIATGFSGDYPISNDDFVLTRYNNNGTLDTTFGNSGKVITDFGNSIDQARSSLIQSDGKIVVAGWSVNSPIAKFALARYNGGNLGGLNDFTQGLPFTVFPNPFSSQITFHSGNFLRNAILTLYNSFGQAVKQMNDLTGQEIILQRENPPSGLYFLRLMEGNSVLATDKLVITDK